MLNKNMPISRMAINIFKSKISGTRINEVCKNGNTLVVVLLKKLYENIEISTLQVYARGGPLQIYLATFAQRDCYTSYDNYFR